MDTLKQRVQMYYTHTTYKVMSGEPHLGSIPESDLIEADGEAEDLFLQNTVDNGYVERYFTAIDDRSDMDIELDITDYIGSSTLHLFENVIDNLSEDEELSYIKANSFYLACLKAKR